MVEGSQTALIPSRDGKTASRSGQRNALGLLHGLPQHGGSCPSATLGSGGCLEVKPGRKLATCYVDSSAGRFPKVREILLKNLRALKAADPQEMEQMLYQEFLRFRTEELGRRAATANPEMNYRIHWAGDFFSREYAAATRRAIERTPDDVMFWTYTRVPYAARILAGTKNLSLYLSLDLVNEGRMLKLYEELKPSGNVSIAYMGKEPPPRESMPEKLVPCPVDEGKIALQYGCHRCKLCFKNKPIFFRT